MKSNSERFIPKIREDIEIFPTSYQGRRALLVKDSLGLIQKPILLEGEIIEFLSLIDGRRNIRDFQLEFMRQKGGVFVSSEEVEKLIIELDSAFLLDSEHYRQEKEKIVKEYSLGEIRSAFHAGRSYPKDKEELKEYLKSFFHPNKGPSLPLNNREILALISPHIDLEVGKNVYSEAYQAIRNCTPQRIILLGTGHNLRESFLSLTEKDFETPLGRVKTDRDCVRKLKKAGKGVVAPNDIAHRSEHSLEFQLVFLQHLFGSDFSLVPLLCGAFRQVLEKVTRPSDIPEMENFLTVLRQLVMEAASETLIVAGVDFSHIGLKFGHSQRASSLLLETKNYDKLLVDAVCQGDVKAFWEETRRVKDKYNVCGFSAVACLLEILKEARGRLLSYDIWQEEPTQSAVSFAAIAFEKRI